MVSFLQIISALTAATAARAALSECFYLQGSAGGKDLQYATVIRPTGNKNYYAEFTPNSSLAPKFGIQPSSGEIRVYATGNNINGRRAAIAPGATSAFAIFDTKTSLTLQNRKPLKCALTGAGILTCAAGDNAAVNVLQYCAPFVSIGNRVLTASSCQALTLKATEAQNCGNFSVGLAP